MSQDSGSLSFEIPETRSKSVFACKIRFPGFMGKSGYLCLHCGDCSLKATTLEAQHIYDAENHRSRKLDQNEDVIVGEFVIRKNKNQSICKAPVLEDNEEIGFVILYGNAKQILKMNKIQRIELESQTFSNCYLTIYDSRKMKKRKHHWLLSDVSVTPDMKHQRFTAQYGTQGELLHILIPSVDDFQALYYLLSHNRELTETEQLQRVRARYPSEKHIEKAFTKLVIRRIMPRERESYMKLAFSEKVMALCKYGSMVAVTTLSDYIISLKSPNIGREVAFLTGAIIDEDGDWVAAFIEELGMKILIDNLLNQRGRRAEFWDLAECGLECIEAIVNKELPRDSIPSLKYVVDNPDFIFFIIINFEHPERKCRQLVFQLVQVMVYFCAENNDEDGFENVMDSMEAYAQEKNYKSLWDIFAYEMNHEMLAHEIDISYLAAIVSLVNLIIGQPYFSNEERIDTWRKLAMVGFQGLLEDVGIDEESMKNVENSTDLHFVGDPSEWLDAAQAHAILKDQDEKSIPDLHGMFDRIYQECKGSGVIFELVKLLSVLDKIPSDLPQIWRSYNDALESRSTRSRHSVCNEMPLAIFEDYDQLQNMGDDSRRMSVEEVQTQLVVLEKSNKKLQRQVETLRSENKRLSGDWSETAHTLKKEIREESPPPSMPIPKTSARNRTKSFGHISIEDDEQPVAEFMKGDPPKSPPQDGIIFPPKPSQKNKGGAQLPVAVLASRFHSKALKKSVSAPAKVTVPTASKSELDPALTKYMKMMKMKIPRQSVLNKMRQDRIPTERIDEIEAYIAGKPLPAAEQNTGESEPTIDPVLMKYVKMLKMKIPRQSVLNKMRQDRIPTERIDEVEAYVAGKPPPKNENTEPTLDPVLMKYVKMLKMKIPRQSVINRMKQDKISEARFVECEAFVAGKPIPKTQDAKPELDPVLQKYVKMLKMNIPRQSVLNKMKQEGHPEDRIQECEAFIAGKPILKKAKITPKKPQKPKEPESKYRNSKMWASIHQLGVKNGIEIEASVFERKKKQPKPKLSPARKAKAKKLICLIQDPKKQQRLQFFQASLRRDKISLTDLQQALWSLNCERFDVANLIAALPDENEMDCVRGFAQSSDLLDAASKLYFSLKNIPEVKSRTELLLYSLTFDECIANFGEQISVLQRAINGIKNSTGLRMMFHMILKVLQINDTNGRFKDGFPLRSLYTVCKRKLVDENMTWLQYIVNMFYQKDRDVLEFVTELRPILAGTEKFSNLDGLGKDINKFALQLRRLKGYLNRYKKKKPSVDPGCKDRFIPYFTQFLDEAEDTVLDLQQDYENCCEDCKVLAQDLGEPPIVDQRINTSYIQTIAAFVDETKKKVEHLHRAEEKVRRRARLEEREKAKKRNKGKKRTVDTVADMLKTNSAHSPGVMEQSLKKIKANTKEIRKTKAPSGYARARGLTVDATNDTRAEAYRSPQQRGTKSKQSIDHTEEATKTGKKQRGSIDIEDDRPKTLPRYHSDNRFVRRRGNRNTPGHRHKLSIHDLRSLEQSVDLVKMRRTSRAQKLSCSFNQRSHASTSFLLNPELTI